MRLKGPETYLVSKEKEDECPIETKIAYNILVRKYNYSGRMSDFPLMLKDVFDIKEFEFFDERTWNSGEFLSYLLDLQINYMNGKEVDMVQLHKDVLKVYTFNMKEKYMFIEEQIEKKLWSIFIYLTRKNKILFDNLNKDD